VASMTEYQMIEISNQQAFGDYPHMTMTPRVEWVRDGKTYTSLSDFRAVVSATSDAKGIAFDASGRMLTAAHQSPPAEEGKYHLTYRLSDTAVEIIAGISAIVSQDAQVRLIVPVVARSDEAVQVVDATKVRIAKQRGVLAISVDAADGFEAVPKERTFNLVPGFECVPLTARVRPGRETRLRIEATSYSSPSSAGSWRYSLCSG